MENMVPILVLTVIGYFVLELVKVVSENRIRNKLIEKGMVDEKVKLLLAPRQTAESASSLKWGLVSIAVGVAFMCAYAIHSWVPASVRDEVMAGVVFSMAGLAMIIYYIIARSRENKD